VQNRKQSAYRAFQSTETAVLKVMADILLALDRGDIAFLILLDLSSAFDTVDHATLLKRMEISYGLGGNLLGWFQSYLSGRKQSVKCNSARSLPTLVLSGVPQGSVLGPVLFLLYTADLLRLVEQFHLHSHLYADDTKIYWFALPLQPLSCKTGFSRVLLRLVCGCALMGSNLIQPRQRSFGLPQVVDRSRFHRLLFA